MAPAQALHLHGKRSDALAVLVAAQYARLDLPFEETDSLGSQTPRLSFVKSLVGPFPAASLVLETHRGPIQFANPCLRYVMRVKSDAALGGRTELEVRELGNFFGIPQGFDGFDFFCRGHRCSSGWILRQMN